MAETGDVNSLRFCLFIVSEPHFFLEQSTHFVSIFTLSLLRERERGGERDRQTETETERERDTHRMRESGRETQREGEREAERV